MLVAPSSTLERPSKNLEHGFCRHLAARGLCGGVRRRKLRPKLVGVRIPERVQDEFDAILRTRLERLLGPTASRAGRSQFVQRSPEPVAHKSRDDQKREGNGGSVNGRAVTANLGTSKASVGVSDDGC